MSAMGNVVVNLKVAAERAADAGHEPVLDDVLDVIQDTNKSVRVGNLTLRYVSQAIGFYEDSYKQRQLENEPWNA